MIARHVKTFMSPELDFTALFLNYSFEFKVKGIFSLGPMLSGENLDLDFHPLKINTYLNKISP